MMEETEKGRRIEQILATDVTREELAEALWCAESSQRMWHECAEENRSLRLKVVAENAKLLYVRDRMYKANMEKNGEILRLLDENDRLVSVLHEVEEEAVLAFNSLQQDCETITDSSQHFFDRWWHAECELDRIKKKNAKLCELIAKQAKVLGVDTSWCYADCAREFECDMDECKIKSALRELGVEEE